MPKGTRGSRCLAFTTACMWRGVINRRNGLAGQPSLELALDLFEHGEGILRGVNTSFGTTRNLSSRSRDLLRRLSIFMKVGLGAR